MVNPYFCYSISFLIAFLVYLLGWSDLYPRLSTPLLIFLISTLVLFTFVGYRVTKRLRITFRSLPFSDLSSPILITLFLYALWIVEFLYQGGIPLFMILLKLPYDYRLFGVPSLHVFIVTFSSFYTVFLFHLFLSTRKKEILFLYLVNLFAAVLIYSRAMFFFNLSASFFLLLLMTRRIPRALVFIGPLSLILLFYCFGVLGTLRVSRESKTEYDNGIFLETGKATASFKNSFVPKEYFWTYIYMSSPLANLQHNINTFPPPAPTITNIGQMINNEILMDFISKRVNSLLGLQRLDENTIPGPFNVSTVYSRSFNYLGWTGILIMATVVLILPWAYFKILPVQSPFFLTGFTILCTMYLFLAYDNTIRFTGLSFQLVYPVVLHYCVAKFTVFKKFFVNNKVTS